MNPRRRQIDETLAERLRRVPLAVYIALLLIGIVVIAQDIVHQRNASRSAIAFRHSVYDQLANATAGFSYDVQMSQWTDSGERTLAPNEPLDMSDSAALDVSTLQYEGSCANAMPISTIAIEFHAPAFTVEPLDTESRHFQGLRQRYCDLRTTTPDEPKWSWVVVPKQAGHHVITLRIVSKDARGRELNDRVVSIPTIVREPPSFSVIIGFLSGIGGLLGTLFTLSDRFRAFTKAPLPGAVRARSYRRSSS